MRTAWTVVLSLGTIALGVALNSWRWIDVSPDGLFIAVGRVVTEGAFWYLLPSTLIFALAFFVGRLMGFALAKKTSR